MQLSIPSALLSGPTSSTEEGHIERWISERISAYEDMDDIAEARIRHIAQLARELRLNVEREPFHAFERYRQRRTQHLMIIDQLQAEIEAQRAIYAHERQAMIEDLDMIRQRQRA